MALAALGLSTVLSLACASGERPTPVLLMAVDGLEWDLVLPMVREGQLPEMARLMDEGTFGRLRTTRPTFSPIIWTSIATGKPPTEHGIRGFVRERGKDRRLFNSYDRKTKAFWNILSDYGRRVAVVGWWMTYPVEDINGVMVAQVNTTDQTRRAAGRAILKGGLVEGLEGQVSPPRRLDEFLTIHARVAEDLPQRMGELFAGYDHPRTALTERLWDNTAWSLRSDAAYVEIAEQLAAEDFDLLACYLGGTDVVAHRFWRYMEPEAFEYPPLPIEIERFGGVIRDYYRYVDSAIGRIRAQMPADTRLLVISDHGMHPVNRTQEFDPDDPPGNINSGHHHGALPGVFLASGSGLDASGVDWRDLRVSDLEEVGSIFDVLPTLLALLDVPLAEDLVGQVLASISLARPAEVSSHDDADWNRERETLLADRLEREGEEERLEQLRALGYIE